ncbi:MAG: Rrf2 family transcriptional regulator [Lachnospiraceae bacterium]|nr:Rrf2 family transcriptional regulator [Lachnospiraceae bacterium]
MITTKGRYAIRVMLDIAENESDKFIPLKDIAARQNISKKYLEIIVKDLVNAKLIVGVSGKGGGYKLCRTPEEYTIGEILELMEGTLSPVACLAEDENDCPRKAECETLPLWEEFDKLIHDFFYGKKLSDICGK